MPTLTLVPTNSMPVAIGRAVHPTIAPPLGIQPQLPLQGLTLLAVEDSRFAADALRLMAQRSGARLRRADTILAARSHLRVYRPDVVLVDLGLPDGRGEDLIRDLAQGPMRPAVILAMSGDIHLRDAALAAGADRFVEKPIAGLAAFQRMILDLLGLGATSLPDDGVMAAPDLMALQDDLVRAEDLLAARQDGQQGGYVAGFVAGIARHAGDQPLADAATDAQLQPDGLALLRLLIADRLSNLGAWPANPAKAQPRSD